MTKAHKRIDWIGVAFWFALFGILFFAGYGARSVFGQGGFISQPATWIVPQADLAEPWLWIETEPGVYIYAGTEPTLVCFDAGSVIVEPGTRLRVAGDSCSVHCPARTCAVCFRYEGKCYVRCDWQTPMNPGQWGEGCPESCAVHPGDTHEPMHPGDSDDDENLKGGGR